MSPHTVTGQRTGWTTCHMSNTLPGTRGTVIFFGVKQKYKNGCRLDAISETTHAFWSLQRQSVSHQHIEVLDISLHVIPEKEVTGRLWHLLDNTHAFICGSGWADLNNRASPQAECLWTDAWFIRHRFSCRTRQVFCAGIFCVICYGRPAAASFFARFRATMT